MAEETINVDSQLEPARKKVEAYKEWKSSNDGAGLSGKIVEMSGEASAGKEIFDYADNFKKRLLNDEKLEMIDELSINEVEGEKDREKRLYTARSIMETAVITSTNAPERILKVIETCPEVFDGEAVSILERRVYEADGLDIKGRVTKMLNSDEGFGDKKAELGLLRKLAEKNPMGEATVYLGLIGGTEAMRSLAEQNYVIGDETIKVADTRSKDQGDALDIIRVLGDGGMMNDANYRTLVDTLIKRKDLENLSPEAKATVVGAIWEIGRNKFPSEVNRQMVKMMTPLFGEKTTGELKGGEAIEKVFIESLGGQLFRSREIGDRDREIGDKQRKERETREVAERESAEGLRVGLANNESAKTLSELQESEDYRKVMELLGKSVGEWSVVLNGIMEKGEMSEAMGVAVALVEKIITNPSAYFEISSSDDPERPATRLWKFTLKEAGKITTTRSRADIFDDQITMIDNYVNERKGVWTTEDRVKKAVLEVFRGYNRVVRL